MACGLRRYYKRSLRVSYKSCILCMFIIVMILVSSYIGLLNTEEVQSDPVSERWRMEKLQVVIRPELETAIIHPKIKHKSICHTHEIQFKMGNEEPLKVLILVTSAPRNTEARNAIRHSWANESFLPSTVNVYFVLGTTTDKKVMESVLKEADKYNDIIMEDFLDSYENLTYKTLFALKWASRHCSRATHLFKTDDDMLIIPYNLVKKLDYIREFFTILKQNVRQRDLISSRKEKQKTQGENIFLNKILNQDLEEKNISEATIIEFNKKDDLCISEQDVETDDKKRRISDGYILGKILRRVRPYRDRNSKWYLPYTLYYQDYLPDFASGTAYVIANGNEHCGVIKSLLMKSLNMTPVLPLEDVFVTGLAAQHLHILLIEDNKRFSSSIPVMFPWTLSRLATCYYDDMIAIHGLKPKDLLTVWEKLQNVTPDECNSISGQIQKNIYALLAKFEMPNG